MDADCLAIPVILLCLFFTNTCLHFFSHFHLLLTGKNCYRVKLFLHDFLLSGWSARREDE